MRSLEWVRSAEHYFDKLPGKIQRQIRTKIDRLTVDPYFNTVPLSGWEGVYRIRSGDWRILYRILPGTIRILSIGPRGDIYK